MSVNRKNKYIYQLLIVLFYLPVQVTLSVFVISSRGVILPTLSRAFKHTLCLYAYTVE